MSGAVVARQDGCERKGTAGGKVTDAIPAAALLDHVQALAVGNIGGGPARVPDASEDRLVEAVA